MYISSEQKANSKEQYMSKLIFISTFIYYLLLSNISLNGMIASSDSVNQISGDCNCQKLIKDDIVVRQCQILPVANDNATQIGLGVGCIKDNVLLTLTVRFLNTAIEIDKTYELSIWLENGNVVDLAFFNGGLAYIGNSQVSQGVYMIDPTQKQKLRASPIKTVAFKLNDGLRRIYQAKMNSGVIFEQLNCL